MKVIPLVKGQEVLVDDCDYGCFDDPRDAARAYNEAALKYYGEFACLNLI